MSKSHSYRHIAQTPARTGTNSGASWSTDRPSRSNTLSTLASSQLPSSTSKSNSMSIPNGHGHGRSMSITGTGLTGTSPGKSFPPRNPGITLPLNNSVSQLATLSHSNHTLSPYARGHEHIAVRSFPHLGKTPSVGAQSRASSGDGNHNRANVKAKRKRIYRLNTKKPEQKHGGGGADEEEEEEEEEMLSPDLDDTPPLSDRHDDFGDDIPEHFRRMSFGSGSRSGSISGRSSIGGWTRHHQQQPSLTGIAQRVMRPNMARSPASRTSYGFPDVE